MKYNVRALTHKLNLPFLTSLVCVALAWEIIGRSADILTLPPLSSVLFAFVDLWQRGVLVEPLLDSTIALLSGLVISITIGLSIGIAIGLSRLMDAAIGPVVRAGLSAPMIAFVPVFMMIFGIGAETRIATVVAFSVFVIATNAATAMRSARADQLEMAHSFGANSAAMIFDIRLSAGRAYLLAGLRLGVARGVKGLINGEVLIAVMGIGGLVKKYGTVFSMDKLYAVILLIIIYATISLLIVTVIGKFALRSSAPD